ncbi:MAG: hypothetical protein IPN89_06660 [Saprospiraceae bacterium]|nr:hypothetical protein [Saprospiraceae bacterium]
MKKYTLWIGVAIWFGACSSSQHLSKPINFKHDVKGLYIEILTYGNTTISGEIISVNDKSMIILPLSNYVQGDTRMGNVKNDTRSGNQKNDARSGDIKNKVMVTPSKSNLPILTVKKDSIRSAEIIVSLTSDHPDNISNWASLINFTTLGHGFWGIITLPMNLAITIPIAKDASKGTYRVKYPVGVDWVNMSKFARFPQGIPRNINPIDIK